jgi:peptidyl-dipeptidase A
MWAQDWTNLADILKPYPNSPDLDITDQMISKGWTIKKMFELADAFFQSLGLDKMLPVC